MILKIIKDLVFNAGVAARRRRKASKKVVTSGTAAVLVGTKPSRSARFGSSGGSPVAAGVDAVLLARNKTLLRLHGAVLLLLAPPETSFVTSFYIRFPK